jgi:chemotaxis protein methyltransferase CheR
MSPDEEVRRNAVSSLPALPGVKALPLMDQALGDESWRVRKAAVEAFKSFPDGGQAARSLIAALADSENAGRRTGAMEALIAMGRSALPYLHDSINHADGDVRKFIVDILGLTGDQSSVDCILPLTRDPSEIIRLAGVEALGAIGGARAFEALLTLLPSEDVSLQFSVLHALGRIGLPIPMDSIRPLFSKKILRRALFDALGQTRSPEAVEFIIDGLSDSTKSALQAAVRALFKLSEDRGLFDFVKQAVNKKLAHVPLGPFTELMDTNHLGTKRAIISLLSMIGTPEAVQALAAASNDDTIQVDVAEAISRIGGLSSEALAEVVRAEPVAGQEVIRVLREVPPPERPIGPMSNKEFQAVRDLVSAETGLYYDRDLKYLMERRVQRRMEELGIWDYERYLHLIGDSKDKGQEERRKLIGVLSTNETYFFREEFQLRAFKEEILPELRERKAGEGSRRIRVWSAGCSSGEEPYTVAILVKESRGLDDFKVEIIGSDISEQMIRNARAAVYNPSSFRATDDSYIRKYFTAEGAKRRLTEEIRKMVSFDSTNLMSCAGAPQLQKLDVIFCRNVIIYFSAEAKKKAVDQFYEMLSPGGYLLLGHSESLMSVSSRFELVHLKHDLVYRKPERGGS